MIYFYDFMLFANMLLVNIYILIVCIIRNAEIRCIKYYHAICALFAQYERHLTQLQKLYFLVTVWKLYFRDWKTVHFNMDQTECDLIA